MQKNLTISAGKDTGFNRFNAYEGYSKVSSTNDLDVFLDDIRAFLTSEPWEADNVYYESMMEERKRPGYREEVIMARGVEAA